jgi:hypothetical protein
MSGATQFKDRVPQLSCRIAVYVAARISRYNGRFMTYGSKAQLSTLALALVFPCLASAQATRTWVSGVGDDANPCSRTAPCKTFAGAISKTAAGGEISALDPGGFGTLTINKSITINGDGTLACILASGTNGMNVSAGVNDVVILRGLSINGASSGTNGIRYLSGGMLVVEHTTIYGFTQNGIVVSGLSGANLTVKDTTMIAVGTGIRVNGSGSVKASLSGVAIRGGGDAVYVLAGATDVSQSTISQNSGVALRADGGVLTAESNMITGNGTAAIAQTGATIRLSNNSVYDNLTGFGCGGGTLASAVNNKKGGNSGGGAMTCAPTVGITIQ